MMRFSDSSKSRVRKSRRNDTSVLCNPDGNDFVAFAKKKFSLTHLAEVEPKHADAYIAYIRQNGRYCRTIPRRGIPYEQNSETLLSSASANQYLRACRQVFKYLLPDLGFTADENPFQHIKGIIVTHVEREIFTQDE